MSHESNKGFVTPWTNYGFFLYCIIKLRLLNGMTMDENTTLSLLVSLKRHLKYYIKPSHEKIEAINSNYLKPEVHFWNFSVFTRLKTTKKKNNNKIAVI